MQIGIDKTFQSTHSYRVRQPKVSVRSGQGVDFNPRTHIECDGRELQVKTMDVTFQSTHSYRVRRDDLVTPEPWNIISIHALI